TISGKLELNLGEKIGVEDYLITIVIPMYNVENSIERLIISISKAFKNQESLVEVLAIDDGSTDKTVKIFEKLQKKNKALALKLIRNSHGGVSKARNTGIKYSTGKYVTFVDSDDELALVDVRSEEHTSELQSRFDLVCRLLLEKK